MAVRLKTENPMLRRKDDARELLDIGDVVCRPYAATDFHVVVMPLQQSLLIEVQRLLFAVRRDLRGKVHFETTPGFAGFLPRRDFFGLNARPGKEKRSVHISPHRASYEVCELQIGPRSLESVPLERGPGLKELFKYLAVHVLDRDPLRFEPRPSIRRSERPVRNPLATKVDFDRHVTEDARFTLDAPEHTTLDQMS